VRVGAAARVVVYVPPGRIGPSPSAAVGAGGALDALGVGAAVAAAAFALPFFGAGADGRGSGGGSVGMPFDAASDLASSKRYHSSLRALLQVSPVVSVDPL